MPSTFRKLIYIDSSGDFKQASQSADSIQAVSFSTANYELTDEMLGYLIGDGDGSTAHNHTSLYFNESDFKATYAGGQVGKPVKLNGSGLADTSLINGSTSHSGLDDLDVDADHLQYSLVDGSRAFSAAVEGISNYAQKATKVIQDLTYTAKLAGTAGNSITISYTDTVTQGNEVATRVGNDYSVAIEDGVSTATQVKAAVDTLDELVDVVISGTAGDAQVLVTSVALLGGRAESSDAALVVKEYVDGEAIAGGNVFTSSGAVSRGNLVYFSANDTVAVWADITTSKAIVGLAAESVATGVNCQVVKKGILTGILSSATFGNKYYWTGSALSVTMPSGVGDHIWLAGVAKNATDLFVIPRQIDIVS